MSPLHYQHLEPNGVFQNVHITCTVDYLLSAGYSNLQNKA